MTSKEAIRVLEDNRPSVIFEDKDAQKRMAELCKAIDMAIEALKANNVETDNIVRISVADRKKDKVILYDAFGENEYYPKQATPTIPCFTESAEAYKAWTGEEMGRPHGEWINREYCQVDEDEYEVATCSNCKSEITIEYPNDNYCPNCGAKMDEEK